MQNPILPAPLLSSIALGGDAVALLQWLNQAGVSALATDQFGENPLAVQQIQAVSPEVAKTNAKAAAQQTQLSEARAAWSDELNQCSDLASLQNYLSNYKGLSLCQTATQAVQGKGQTEQPYIMVIAEAPDAQEDQSGQAFSGQAHSMLEKAVFFAHGTLDNVYFTYLSKWRPPGQRSLLPPEMELAQAVLLREIALVQPQHMIMLSETVLRAVTRIADSLEKLPEDTKLTISPAQKAQIVNIYDIDFKHKNNKNGPQNRALALQKPDSMLRDMQIKKRVWQNLLSFCRALTI